MDPKEFNFDKLEVETDAKSLVFMLDTSSLNPHPHHELAVLLSDVADLLKRNWSVSFTHIPRSSNMVAHMLAVSVMDMAVGHQSHLMIPPSVKKWYESDLQVSNPVGDCSTSTDV
ncbi:hypothetical protein SOVF_136390 [Spinacia oleracea]|uniref:RNase H type-1 domain-containing protein n=1 Tax=Spinacia oleracea TaxID=3562 RepID=A0A9R0I062_SPIOL|nr:uncharacterized protein LOC110784531 [Spinacia oleracea]KNA11311.1 hypothetical protein SOVF_136390 [Spinacia oleracea]